MINFITGLVFQTRVVLAAFLLAQTALCLLSRDASTFDIYWPDTAIQLDTLALSSCDGDNAIYATITAMVISNATGLERLQRVDPETSTITTLLTTVNGSCWEHQYPFRHDGTPSQWYLALCEALQAYQTMMPGDFDETANPVKRLLPALASRGSTAKCIIPCDLRVDMVNYYRQAIITPVVIWMNTGTFQAVDPFYREELNAALLDTTTSRWNHNQSTLDTEAAPYNFVYSTCSKGLVIRLFADPGRMSSDCRGLCVVNT